MRSRITLGSIIVAALCAPLALAQAQDTKTFPNWEGLWGRHSRIGIWDTTKPAGLGQQAPLTPEYRAIHEANIKKSTEGKDYDPKANCYPPGMPRIMMIYQPMEVIFKPGVVYMLLEAMAPVRRVFTDGRPWPKIFQPGYNGYSIGQWHDQDGDGRYDTLTVETRGISGARMMDNTGMQLHKDDSTIVQEKIYLDKNNPDIMTNEITTIDSAFTRPWTVTRQYRRLKNQEHSEYNCEDKANVTINGEYYLIGVDGYLLPTAKGQRPPDLKYFDQTQR